MKNILMIVLSVLLSFTLYNLNEIKEKRMGEYLILVNKQNGIGLDFEPKNLTLVELPTINNREVYLEKRAYVAYKRLFRNATKNNINLIIFSGYRDSNYQKMIFTNEFITAKPGYSEHQLGLAVDVSTADIGLTEILMYSQEGRWLNDNAYKYGFIIRYPKNKEHITEYIHEPWHLRYVGENHAKNIETANLSLEEYLKIRNNN